MRECLVACLLVVCCGCAVKDNKKQLRYFIARHVTKVEPLSARANLVYWEAATTGRPEKFEALKQLQLKVRRIYSDVNDFARIKKFDE